jgi:hypothetical protein
MEPDNTEGWTFTTLKAYFESRLDAAKTALAAALQAVEKSNEKVAIALEKRLEGVNEWRQTFSDRDANFAPREDTERRLRMLEKWVGKLSGIGAFVGIVGVLVTIAFAFFGK